MDFAQREWRAVLDALEFFTPRAFWVNPRAADIQAKNKPAQLIIARELGLTLPTSLISNDPSEVEKFVSTGSDDYVYKPLTWYFDPPDRIVFTSAVTREQIAIDPEAISLAPGIFQVRIPKAYEVRATVVGDEVFSVRIDSQAREDTKLDWRRNQGEVPYARHTLPDDVRILLLAMNARLGLVYGAYDLIVTPSEQYVFLEVNPVGQWLWLERATGIPISKALAELLLRPSAHELCATKGCSRQDLIDRHC
jgi:glutathione synthase/RimK-type ligase-like ATP-grasp enzyme